MTYTPQRAPTLTPLGWALAILGSLVVLAVLMFVANVVAAVGAVGFN
jgi:Na+-transporting methylmalonyl-CoA/oxaloacetate decarboxylase gamma subunit